MSARTGVLAATAIVAVTRLGLLASSVESGYFADTNSVELNSRARQQA